MKKSQRMGRESLRTVWPSRLLLFILPVLLLLPLSVHAGKNVAVTAVPVLKFPVGARAAVLGPGFVSCADDVHSMGHNPAGLSLVKRREASFLYLKGVEDTSLEFLGYGQPLSFTGLLNNGYPALGAGVLYSQNGTIEVNRTNPADGSLRDSRSYAAGSDVVAMLGYAERLGDYRMLGGRVLEFFAGVDFKFIHSTLAEKYSATGEAADAGFLAALSEPKLTLGLSVINFGPSIKYLHEEDPLPLSYRGALSYSLATIWDQVFLATLGAEYASFEQEVNAVAGLEWTLRRQFSLRTGYRFAGDSGSMPFGAGFSFIDKNFQMDYAWVPFDVLSDQHRLTLTVRFGEEFKRESGRREIRDIERSPLQPWSVPKKQPEKPSKKPAQGPSIIVPGWE